MINEIRKFSTVVLHYVGRLDDGSIFNSTYEKMPEKFQIGTGKAIRGIEESIMGKRPGDRIIVKISPEDAYGYRDPLKIQNVNRNQLPPDTKAGGEVIAHYQSSPNVWNEIRALVLEVNEDFAKLDYNHPLAGRELNFQIEIVDVKVKKKFAVFTIVKNENYFLPKWIKHYRRFLDNDDIYVLDHQSDDGSTDGLDVNVIRVINEVAFDHQWIVDTVQRFQERLLDDYECVIYAESDEIIYSSEMDLDKMIEEFIKTDLPSIRCKGFEVMQDLERESPLEDGEDILTKRDYWFPFPMYDKTILARVPLKWQLGFHTCVNMKEDENPYAYGLTLCHLHRADFELMLKRHERAKKWNLRENRPGDRDGVLEYFNSVKKEYTIESIPDVHKNAMVGI